MNPTWIPTLVGLAERSTRLLFDAVRRDDAYRRSSAAGRAALWSETVLAYYRAHEGRGITDLIGEVYEWLVLNEAPEVGELFHGDIRAMSQRDRDGADLSLG